MSIIEATLQAIEADVSINITDEGTTTYINSVVLNVNDPVVNVSYTTSGVPTENAGVEVIRGSSTNATMLWNESQDKWTCGLKGSEQTILTATNTETVTNKSIDASQLTGTVNVARIADASLALSKLSDSTVTTSSNTQTLTNKSIAASQLTGTVDVARIADASLALSKLSDSTVTTSSNTQTLTNKSIAASQLTGTIDVARIADASLALSKLSDSTVTTSSNTQTLTNKTWSGSTIAIASGGTNNTSAYTGGSVIYSNGTSLTQDNANLYYASGTLGIGTNAPSSKLHLSLLSSGAASDGVLSDVNTPPLSLIMGDTRNHSSGGSGLEFDRGCHWIYNADAQNRYTGAGAVLKNLAGISMTYHNFGSYPSDGNQGNTNIKFYTTNNQSASVSEFTEKMRILYNGNVGIGITAPTAKLHVNNTTTANSLLIEDDTTPDSTPFVVSNTGLVGVGLTTPTSLLHVTNTRTTPGFVMHDNNLTYTTSTDNVNAVTCTQTNTLTMQNTVNITGGSSSTVRNTALRNSVSIPDDVSYGNITSVMGSYTELSNSRTTSTVSNAVGTMTYLANNATGTITNFIGSHVQARNVSTGTVTSSIGSNILATNVAGGVITTNIGIGNTASNGAGGSMTTQYGIQSTASNNTGTITTQYGCQITASNNTGTVTTNTGLRVITTNAGAITTNKGIQIDMATSGVSGNNHTIFASADVQSYLQGNLGVGIPLPLAKLHVNNTTSANSLLIEDDTTPDSTPFVISNAGLVGIGRTAPNAMLNIHAREVSTDFLKCTSTAPSNTGTEDNSFYVRLDSSGHALMSMGNATSNGSTSQVQLHSSGDSYFNSGNVGIGITAPLAKLHIVQTSTDGTTDAFRVDDEASDSTYFKIDQAGIASFRQQAAATQSVVRVLQATSGDMAAKINVDSTGFGSIDMIHTDGNAIGASLSGNTSGTSYVMGSLGVGIATPAASAVLDITSTTKGMLPPRSSSDPSSPATGLVYYNTTDNKIKVYNGSVWKALDEPSAAASISLGQTYYDAGAAANTSTIDCVDTTAFFRIPFLSVFPQTGNVNWGIATGAFVGIQYTGTTSTKLAHHTIVLSGSLDEVSLSARVKVYKNPTWGASGNAATGTIIDTSFQSTTFPATANLNTNISITFTDVPSNNDSYYLTIQVPGSATATFKGYSYSWCATGY